jgi:DNA-binding HxlR family transcriptional regulator
MRQGYGDYCPIALGAEIFAERWTPLIVRNLYLGARTFTDIHGGVPRMSRTLLAQRLVSLERDGIVERHPRPVGRGWLYALTPAGRELAEVCLALGTWGARWLDVTPRHADPAVMLWAWCHLIDRDRLPPRRVVVRFEVTGWRERRCWMLLHRDDVEVCIRPPGLDEDLVVTTDVETLARIHSGPLTVTDAIRSGRCTVTGPADLVRAFPGWGGKSPFTGVPAARTPANG